MSHLNYLLSFIGINIFILWSVRCLSPYDTPSIIIRHANITQVQVINQNTYFILQRTQNSTVFIPYYYSLMDNYYSYFGSGYINNLCLSKSKQILFMVQENQINTKLLRWSVHKREFLATVDLTGQVMELLSLRIDQNNYYLMVAYKNGNINIFKDKNQQLIYVSNFKFEFFSKNYKIIATKDGETVCVVYAYGQKQHISYEIYFFTINFQGIFQFVASNNFTYPNLTVPLNEPKISMTWTNFSAIQLSDKQIFFSTENHKGVYFKAYLQKIGTDKDYVLQIQEFKDNFGTIYGIVPSLSYEFHSFDIFSDSTISTISPNGLSNLLQNGTIKFLQLASTFNYILLGYSSHTAVYIYTIPRQLDLLGILMSYLTGSYAQLVLSSILSTPSCRQALNYFQSLFFNIDDFWLFMYQKRKFGYTIESIFNFARISQNQKWKIYGVQNEFTLVSDLQKSLDKYFHYDFWTHKTYLALEDRSEALLSNTIQFFLLTLPFSIIVFGIFKIIYCITSRFSIGKLFKRYSFTGYLLIILCEGNLQYFSYLCINQLRMLFFFNIVNKLVIVFTVLFFFFVIFACIGMFMLLKYWYKKKICEILDCEKSNEKFIFWITYEFGIRNVLLGFAHAILNDSYYYQMGAIILIDSLSIIYIYILFVDSKSYFAGNWQFLMKMINYFIRILLYATLIVQYAMNAQNGDIEDQSSKQLIELFDFIQQKIVLMIILSWILSFFVEIIPKKIVRPQHKNIKAKKIKKINKLNMNSSVLKTQKKSNQESSAGLTNYTIEELKNEFQIINLEKTQHNIQQEKISVLPVGMTNQRQNSQQKRLKTSHMVIMHKNNQEKEQNVCSVIKIDQIDKKIDALMY